MANNKKAAALKYEIGYETPIVTATGMGRIADTIVKLANENDVPVVYNKELTELLTNVDVGDSIPLALYDVVAEVIAYVMELDDKVKKKR